MNRSHPSRSTPEPKASMHVLQEWEGYVVEMRGDEFVARLVDLTAGSTHEEEEAIIPKAAISGNGVATVLVGGIFRWVIGHERSSGNEEARVPDRVSRPTPDDGARFPGRPALGERDDAGVQPMNSESLTGGP